MGEARDHLIQCELGGCAAAHRADMKGLFSEVGEELVLLIEVVGFTASHHQQGATQGLGPAPENRSFQIMPTLIGHVDSEVAAFRHSHGPHWDDG